ncbi:transcriptional regulator [Natronogracilivirga saccharolytica]|uniref:Transcriptional regulator n=1 Tax=Natronogracilivirga saccharolytica TaxID=2812953 RepID=A0A8J7RJ08_9BACT|nr:transcriptional regulator [Natronogracilivirga saccharolytica]MBP3191610.1 transcriptional regulator [Natronogracilivirga saccharolytica]
MASEPIYLDYRKLDNLIHSRIRLALMSVLTRVDDLSFNELKKSVNATDGNLSTHLSRLEEAGYIQVEKITEGNKTESRYSVTEKGLTAFARYIMDIEPFIG